MVMAVPEYQLPSSLEDWTRLIRYFGLDDSNLSLSDVRQQRPTQLRAADVGLSGSTMAGDDVLCFRVVWHDSDPDSARCHAFAKETLQDLDLLDETSYLAALGRLGLETHPDASVPPRRARARARGLDSSQQRGESPGNAAQAQTPKRQALSISTPSAPKQRSAAGPGLSPEDDHVLPCFHQFILALSKGGLTSDPLTFGPFLPALDAFRTIYGLSTWDTSVPIAPAASTAIRPGTSGGGDSGAEDPFADPFSDNGPVIPATPTPKSRHAPAPNLILGTPLPRTPGKAVSTEPPDDKPPLDETSVTMFATTFFTSLSACVASGQSGYHRMEPRRVHFRCGPWNSQPLLPSRAYFKAAVDAVVESSGIRLPCPFDGHAKPLSTFIISEFKAQELTRQSKFKPVQIQEAAEMMAFLANWHAPARGQKEIRAGRPRVLMLSQYRLQISIVVAQYSDAWLKYLLGVTQGPVYHDQLEEDDLLHLHRIGTYHVQVPEEMYALATLLTAITIHDWRQGGRGSKTLLLRSGKGPK